MSKIKPIIKTNNKSTIFSWILEKFPEDYQKMRYVEPFVGNGSILLNKEKSIEEIAGDSDLNIVNLWKVIKDEYKVLKKRLDKVNYSEKAFNEIKISNEKEKEYSKMAAIELCLRKMSKNENKQIFDSIDRKKANQSWKQTVDSLESISERVSNVYFLNIKPIDVISSFTNDQTFCFCSPENSDADLIDVCEQLRSFRGKAMFCAENSAVYRRLFTDWKCSKHKNKKHVIWYNF